MLRSKRRVKPNVPSARVVAVASFRNSPLYGYGAALQLDRLARQGRGPLAQAAAQLCGVPYCTPASEEKATERSAAAALPGKQEHQKAGEQEAHAAPG